MRWCALLLLVNFYSPAGSGDDTGYRNPAFDQLFHELMVEMDPAKRLTLGEAAERLMLADYPVVPLYFEALNRMVNPRLEGFPDGIVTPQSRYLAWAK
jgi:oligopeptide transport system substrate-binding protein